MKVLGLEKEILKRLLLYVLMVLALIRFLLIPAKNSLNKERELFESYKHKLRQKELQLAKIQEIANKTEQDLNNSSKLIPAHIYSREVDPFELQLRLLKDLLKVIQEKKLDLQSFSLPSISYGKTITEIPVELKFSGRPKDVFSLFDYLEKQEKRVYIKDCTISESFRRLFVSVTITVIKSEI